MQFTFEILDNCSGYQLCIMQRKDVVKGLTGNSQLLQKDIKNEYHSDSSRVSFAP